MDRILIEVDLGGAGGLLNGIPVGGYYVSKGQKGSATWINIIGAKISCDGSDGGKVNLEMKTGNREQEQFGGYMGSHRRFYSRDVIGLNLDFRK